MFHVPPHILEYLKCSVCGGFLSTKPIMVKDNHEQVCGKCFEILPEEESIKCLQQVGLEAIVDVLIFPCQYCKEGCRHTFTFNKENNHESGCSYRYLNSSNNKGASLLDVNYNSLLDNKTQVIRETPQLKAIFNFELTESKYSPDFKHLKYNFNIHGNHDKSLAIRNGSNATDMDSVSIDVNGAILLKHQPETLYTDIKVKPMEENIYETVKKQNDTQRCTNCNITLAKEVEYCLFGHETCANCKGNMCILCVNQINRESKKNCRNIKNGCREMFALLEIKNHEDNCLYKNLQCPFEWCDFKCVYYYYKTFVEFCVTYVGSAEDAEKYTIEICVVNEKKPLKKRSKCSHWNNFLLETGITFERKDLLNENEKKLNFEVKLKICRD